MADIVPDRLNWGFQQTCPLEMVADIGSAAADRAMIDLAAAKAAEQGLTVSGDPEITRFAIAYRENKNGIPVSVIVPEDEATHRGYVIWYHTEETP